MKKKILFIILPYVFKESKLMQRSFLAMPNGVLSISKYIEHLANVEIFDCNLNEDYFSYIPEKIKSSNPDIIGISMMFDTSYKYLSPILKIIKTHSPYSTIIMGGISTLQTYKEILNENPEIDAICPDEGEIAVKEYLTTGKFKKGWATKGSIDPPIKNVLSKLDDIIDIDYSLIDVDKYHEKIEETYSPFMFGKEGKKQFYVITTRGCPYNCLSGETLINTIYGNISIKEISEKYETIPVLTYNKNSKQILFTDAINIKKTREKAQLVRVYFDDRTYIDCTPDHKFLTFKNNNQFGKPHKEIEIEAQYLKEKQSVRAVKIRKNRLGYVDIEWKRYSKKIHRVVAEYKYNKKLKKSDKIHHIDHDKTNNHPDNLFLCESSAIHMKLHPEISERMKTNNPAFNMPKDFFVNLGKKQKGKKRTKAQKLKYRNSKLGKLNPNYKELPFSLEKEFNNIIYCKNLRKYIKNFNISYSFFWKHFKIKYNKSVDEYRKYLGIKRKNLKNEINHKVIKVEWLVEKQDTYCMEVPKYNWFFANNVLVHNCIFCKNSLNPDKSIRYASVNSIINHVEKLIEKYRMNVLTFYDEQILYNRERAKNLFRRLQPYGLRIEMPNGLSIAYMDEELIDLMWNAGVDCLVLALESGSAEVLKMMHKPVNLDQARNVIKIIRKYNFFLHIFLVIGIPGETDVHRQETVDFIREVKPDIISPKIAAPVYGSRLRQECIQKKYIKNVNVGTFEITEAVINTPEYSAEYINEQIKYMNWRTNFVENYRASIGDTETAKKYFEYVARKYPTEAFAWYFLNNMEMVKKCISENPKWIERFEYFGIKI